MPKYSTSITKGDCSKQDQDGLGIGFKRNGHEEIGHANGDEEEELHFFLQGFFFLRSACGAAAYGRVPPVEIFKEIIFQCIPHLLRAFGGDFGADHDSPLSIAPPNARDALFEPQIGYG